MLRGMGLSDEQISTVIEAHAETVDGLKSELSKYKEDHGKLATLQQELDELKSNSGDSWKAKYDSEHSEYEKFKGIVAKEKSDAVKDKLYRSLLKEANVDESRHDSIMRVTDLDSIKVEDGKIVDSDKVTDSIKSEWSGFIVESRVKGATVDNPPGGSDMTKESFLAMSLTQRMSYANEHPNEAREFMK